MNWVSYNIYLSWSITFILFFSLLSSSISLSSSFFSLKQSLSLSQIVCLSLCSLILFLKVVFLSLKCSFAISLSLKTSLFQTLFFFFLLWNSYSAPLCFLNFKLCHDLSKFFKNIHKYLNPIFFQILVLVNHMSKLGHDK